MFYIKLPSFKISTWFSQNSWSCHKQVNYGLLLISFEGVASSTLIWFTIKVLPVRVFVSVCVRKREIEGGVWERVRCVRERVSVLEREVCMREWERYVCERERVCVCEREKKEELALFFKRMFLTFADDRVFYFDIFQKQATINLLVHIVSDMYNLVDS